jgi:hypothetical protein
VKDRHIMMLAVLAVFIGAMLFISELASNPAVASSRNQQTIPDELSTELDMSTPENPSTPDTTPISQSIHDSIRSWSKCPKSVICLMKLSNREP